MTKKNVLVVISSLVILFLLGCPQEKKIGQINQDPQRYVNKDIAVKGTVVNSFSALVTGAYELDDGTGTLWVLSNGGVPAGPASRSSTPGCGSCWPRAGCTTGCG